MLNRFKGYLADLGGEPTVIICGASALLIVSHYQGSAGYWRVVAGNTFDGHPAAAAMGHLWWFAASFGLYFVMPLLLAVATRGSFHRSYGLGLGDVKAGLGISALFLAVMVPAVSVASQLDTFRGMYPLAGNAAYQLVVDGKPQISWAMFVVYEAAYFSYFVGWEFLYRGWMLNGLLPHWGRAGAVLVQVAPFAVMHLGKPELEALGSIIAGVALGVLALRTRSFWYGAFIHGAVAVWMDWCSARATLLGP